MPITKYNKDHPLSYLSINNKHNPELKKIHRNVDQQERDRMEK